MMPILHPLLAALDLRLPRIGAIRCILSKIMRIQSSRLFAFVTLVAMGAPLCAQQQAAAPQGAERQAAPAPAAAKPQDTEAREPLPNVVAPCSHNKPPPSDP